MNSELNLCNTENLFYLHFKKIDYLALNGLAGVLHLMNLHESFMIDQNSRQRQNQKIIISLSLNIGNALMELMLYSTFIFKRLIGPFLLYYNDMNELTYRNIFDSFVTCVEISMKFLIFLLLLSKYGTCSSTCILW